MAYPASDLFEGAVPFNGRRSKARFWLGEATSHHPYRARGRCGSSRWAGGSARFALHAGAHGIAMRLAPFKQSSLPGESGLLDRRSGSFFDMRTLPIPAPHEVEPIDRLVGAMDLRDRRGRYGAKVEAEDLIGAFAQHGAASIVAMVDESDAGVAARMFYAGATEVVQASAARDLDFRWGRG